jgi:alkanesulfonate monooxygenase SsuD/methylene tetrahydromethanopterin reductase-like flavin-dependent oxidoreductase (luciferase family)
MMSTVNVGVQADPTEEPAWAAFARRVEELAFDGLLVAGHPGAGHTRRSGPCGASPTHRRVSVWTA